MVFAVPSTTRGFDDEGVVEADREAPRVVNLCWISRHPASILGVQKISTLMSNFSLVG